MEKDKKVTRELKNYYIGLDVGTDSIGWAVTDENYELLRERGRDFWGARICWGEPLSCYERGRTFCAREL